MIHIRTAENIIDGSSIGWPCRIAYCVWDNVDHGIFRNIFANGIIVSKSSGKSDIAKITDIVD